MTRALLAFAVVGVVTACHPHATPASPPSAPRAHGFDMVVDGCPPTLDDAIAFVDAHAICVLGSAPTCEYETGACGCEEPPQCGGAHMPHPAGSDGRWRCSSPNVDVVDKSGCPINAPPNGTACTGARACSYDACASAITTASCVDGAWRVEQVLGPVPM